MSLLQMLGMQQPNPTGWNALEQKKQLMQAQPPQPMPAQQPPQQPGFMSRVGDYLGDRSNRMRMAAAFNSMRLNPDPGISRMAQQQQLMDYKDKKETERANQTIEFLKAKGVPNEIIEAAKGSPDILMALVQRATEKPEKPSSFAEKVAALEATGMSREEAINKVISSGGTSINMPQQMGTIPPGYQAVYDDQGRISRMEPIEGGPVASEQEDAEQTSKQSYAAYKAGVAELSKAFGQANTGSLVGLAPAFTSGDMTFEGIRDVMLQPLKGIFRGKGEGTFTDDDARQLMGMMPTRRDTQESAEAKLRAADMVIRAKLGMPLSDGSGGPPLTSAGTPPVVPTKRYNEKTGKLEDIK